MRSPKYFLDLADKARALAGEMNNEEALSKMLAIVDLFEQLARLAEENSLRPRKASSAPPFPWSPS